MTREQLKKLFPLEGEITKEILGSSNIHDIKNCLGANTLRESLQQAGVPHSDLTWGAIDGSFYLEGDLTPMGTGSSAVWVTTEEKINFMGVKEPMSVTFQLYEPSLN